MKRTDENSLASLAIQLAVQLVASGVLALLAWLITVQAWRKWGDVGLSVALVVLVVLLLIANELHKRWSVYRTYYPRYPGNFVVRNKVLTYNYTAEGELTFSRKMQVEAVKSGQHCFLDRYLWTGKAPAIPETKTEHYEIRPVSRAGIWQFFEVDFGRTIKKGEIVAYEIVQRVIDQDFASGPFFSTSIEEPTYRLEFRLNLASSLGIETVTKEILRGIESHYSYKVETDQLENGEYSWVINRPRFHRHYRIYWRWPKMNAAESPIDGALGVGNER